jgi:hypothetical protein
MKGWGGRILEAKVTLNLEPGGVLGEFLTGLIERRRQAELEALDDLARHVLGLGAGGGKAPPEAMLLDKPEPLSDTPLTADGTPNQGRKTMTNAITTFTNPDDAMTAEVILDANGTTYGVAIRDDDSGEYLSTSYHGIATREAAEEKAKKAVGL